MPESQMEGHEEGLMGSGCDLSHPLYRTLNLHTELGGLDLAWLRILNQFLSPLRAQRVKEPFLLPASRR